VLFKDAFLNPIHYVRRMISMIVNDELEMMWKEVTMAYYKVLSQHLRGGTEKTFS